VVAYSSRVDAALTFAAIAHGDQRRKSTDVPYITHPVHVAMILVRHGCDEDTIIAGILHDVLEDTETDAATLEARFGPRVTETVIACSEPNKEIPWEERKTGAVERMRRMPPAARAVCCADKAHNLHTMADVLERGEDVWARFRRGAAAQINYHRNALEALRDGWTHPILEELEAALRRIDELTRDV
jgi:(p)ppGpp synthase/HD superfamily hydrolase